MTEVRGLEPKVVFRLFDKKGKLSVFIMSYYILHTYLRVNLYLNLNFRYSALFDQKVPFTTTKCRFILKSVCDMITQLNLFTSLVKWLSIRLRIKWLLIRIPLQSLKKKSVVKRKEKNKQTSK